MAPLQYQNNIIFNTFPSLFEFRPPSKSTFDSSVLNKIGFFFGVMISHKMWQTSKNTLFPGLQESNSLKSFSLYSNHLLKEFQEQMTPHLKALIQGVQNQERNWAWHHPEGGHAPLTKKSLLSIKLIWSPSRQEQQGFLSFLSQMGQKWRTVKV